MEMNIDQMRSILDMVASSTGAYPEHEVLEAEMGELVFGYQCTLLEDAGLLVGIDVSTMANPYGFQPTRLTYDGHEQLAMWRDDSTFEKTKKWFIDNKVPLVLAEFGKVALNITGQAVSKNLTG